MAAHIHVTGASGAGVTTLGAALAASFGGVHLDTDDFYWWPTVPPYREKRGIEERLARLREAFAAAERGWVLSGSLCGWGDPLIPCFDRIVYVTTPTEVRLARLRVREALTFGAASVAPGGELHAEYTEFLEWAGRYDFGDRTGRSRALHEAWLAQVPCPVLRVDGSRPIGELVDALAV